MCCDAEKVQRLIDYIKQMLDSSIFDIDKISAIKIKISLQPNTISNKKIYLRSVFVLKKKDENERGEDVNVEWDTVVDERNLLGGRVDWTRNNTPFQELEGNKGIYIIINCAENCKERKVVYIGGQKEKRDQSLKERVKKLMQRLAGSDADHTFAKKLIEELEKFNCINNNILCLHNEEEILCVYFLIILMPLQRNEQIEKIEGCFHTAFECKYFKSPYFVDLKPATDFKVLGKPEEVLCNLKKIFEKIDETLGG